MRLVPLLAVLVLVSACGGTAQAAPTRAEFIRKGDAVCAQTQRELVPVLARAQAAKLLPQGEQLAALTGMWADQIEIQKKFVGRMKAIGTPAGDGVARKLVDSLEHGVTLAVDVQRGFKDGDSAALSTALPAYVNFTFTLNRRVVVYGFRTCGAGA
jgi:hypothetical protein